MAQPAHGKLNQHGPLNVNSKDLQRQGGANSGRVASASANVLQKQPVHSAEAKIENPSNVKKLNFNAQQVAEQCDKVYVRCVKKSGYSEELKIGANDEKELQDKFVKLRDLLIKHKVLPPETKKLNINPGLLLVKYLDKDDNLREASLLDLFTADKEFQEKLKDLHTSLKKYIPKSSPSSLSQLQPASGRVPMLRRSWDDVNIMQTKQKLDLLNKTNGPFSKTHDQNINELKSELKRYTVHDEIRFPQDLKQHEKIHKILHPKSQEQPSGEHKERARKVGNVITEFNKKLKELIKDTDQATNQQRYTQLVQLQQRMNEIDCFALHVALAAYEPVKANAVDQQVADLHDKIHEYCKEQRQQHKKQIKNAIDSHPHYAKDVASLLYSATNDPKDKSYQNFCKNYNITPRERSCVDELFTAIVLANTNDEIAQKLIDSHAFGRGLGVSDKQALKDAILAGLAQQ